jgi:FkbM family methyltransferase
MTSDEALRLHDLRLLATVTSYDLRDRQERRRSARDLAQLFLRLCESIEPDLMVEAGANSARTSRRVKRRVGTARVVAFEANPYTFERYRLDNPPESGIEYLHLALGDRSGQVRLNVRRTEDGAPRADGHGSLMERPDDYEHDFESVTVPATNLDEFFGSGTYRRCALWVDVEGAASSVLLGGRELLASTQVVMIEVEDRQYWKGAWRAPEVMRFLADRDLIPIARDFEYRHQYNLVLVRRELLDHDLVRLRLSQYLSACRFPEVDGGE